MADVVDHPLGNEELGQLGQAPRRKGQTVVGRAGQGDLFDLASLGQGEGRRPPAGVTREQRVEAVLVEVVQHGADPVRRSEGHLDDLGHVHPWALSSTIWALRQVTTDPEDRRTIRSSRLPSSLVIARTRTPSRT